MTSQHFIGEDLCADKRFGIHCGDSGDCGVEPTYGAFEQEGADTPNAGDSTRFATPSSSERQSFPPSKWSTEAVSLPFGATNGVETVPIDEDFDRI
jgi:hypothetical protein